MKKSNIILISILGIFLVMIVVIQIHLKTAISISKDTSVDLKYDSFNTIQIGSGWYIEMVEGEETQISIPADSIKEFIISEGNMLKLKDLGTTNKKVKIEITNKSLKHLNINGNSFIKYDCNFIDSIFITQSGSCRAIINDIAEIKSNGDINTESGLINYMSIIVSDTSNLKVSHNIKTLEGKLNDDCNLSLSGEVSFKNFRKSKTSDIRSW